MNNGNASTQLANHNLELLECIEKLKQKRDELARQIGRDEEEKHRLQQDLAAFTQKLTAVNQGLEAKLAAREDYDKVISETEGAYCKIVESSQTLLTILKKECKGIQQRSTAVL